MPEKYNAEKRTEVFQDALKILDLIDADILAQLNYEYAISDGDADRAWAEQTANDGLEKTDAVRKAISEAGLAKPL